MSAESHPTLPPVRLHSDAELAREALGAPLFARAVRLARWAGPDTRVGVGGELATAQLPEAAAVLGLEAADEDSAGYASQAWRVAVDTGLVDVTEPEDDGGKGDGGEDDEERFGTATPGEDLALVTGGAPGDVLDLWLAALDTVLADAAVPDLDDLVDALDAGGEIDFDRLDWNPGREADFLDGVLANLYLLTVAEGGAADEPVPLPVLAASMVVPDDMGEPTDAVLEQVSDAMMRLDDQFRQLEPIGLVEFRPVDEALMAEAEGPLEPETASAVDDEDVSRYGMVRLTPLGLYGVRARMLEAGVDAPAVGELAEKGADVLLDAVSSYSESAAQAEIEQWLAGREPAAAAAELLAAARGDDEGGPLRRLRCQQALAPAGPEAEPAVRSVLDDPELGGLARVWLAERGVSDVPAPDQEMVFWLTVDTIAAQLAADGETEELPLLMETLTAHHAGFFEQAWRVEHPATAYVLEAMGRLHPDRKAAKEARKAAFKARSRRPA
ncbi:MULTISPECIES: hypothetical protein [Streptomyces]|uniref:XPB/Ssl2-like helicase family protein n=1 Tax=Streptomyces spororaveus TaxID=284039 RepID=A0ABQ3TK82_9ACTN|nr:MULTISPECIES: hypothetical protein [Streptomyces]MCM9078846.1 hypothetical protein [Streptomyces spororaveus]MCX5306737.1 hypothetical protein [Streptomyces sp. NBC_00160]GHI80832.1 hypothetical protein Sspor_63930 [Streptomyces spororaveus]